MLTSASATTSPELTVTAPMLAGFGTRGPVENSVGNDPDGTVVGTGVGVGDVDVVARTVVVGAGLVVEVVGGAVDGDAEVVVALHAAKPSPSGTRRRCEPDRKHPVPAIADQSRTLLAPLYSSRSPGAAVAPPMT